jgi:signal transduction histidine kinase
MTLTPATMTDHNQAGARPPLWTVNWLARLLAFVVVAVITLVSHSDHRVAVLAALASAAVLFIAWLTLDLAATRGRQIPAAMMVVVLGGLGVAGGLVAALPIGDTLVAFPIMAAIAAGAELPIGLASGVAASSILAVEVSALLFGFSSGELGWPMAIIASVLIGRNRRDSRERHEQAIALVAQAERTRSEEQRAATLDERARIAREIHDLLAHSLGALGIQLEAAEAVLTDTRDVDRALPLLHGARQLAASGLEETRHAIEALRTDTPPLPETLRSLAEGPAEEYHTPTDLTVTGAARALKPETNLTLFRITREALANSVEHAPSVPIAISLAYGLDATTVTITNALPPVEHSPAENATGSSGPKRGYGLAGMRERLLLIGGTLSAGESESGWTVRARVPL